MVLEAFRHPVTLIPKFQGVENVGAFRRLF